MDFYAKLLKLDTRHRARQVSVPECPTSRCQTIRKRERHLKRCCRGSPPHYTHRDRCLFVLPRQVYQRTLTRTNPQPAAAPSARSSLPHTAEERRAWTLARPRPGRAERAAFPPTLAPFAPDHIARPTRRTIEQPRRPSYATRLVGLLSCGRLRACGQLPESEVERAELPL